MKKTFEDYGIQGVNPEGPVEQKVVCPREGCSSARKKKSEPCLRVNVEKGVWHCHHCGWKGKLHRIQGSAASEFQPKSVDANFGDLTPEVYDWFASRGISREIVDSMGVKRGSMYSHSRKATVGAIAYPYFYDGAMVNVKYRSRDKEFMQIKGGSSVLWNIDCVVRDGCSEVVIVEGEMDALAFMEAGVRNVLSVPDGAPAPGSNNLDNKMRFLDNCSDVLADVDKFYLAVDADGAGKRLRDELGRRLGRERCYLVHFPDGCKDANDVLLAHGKEELAKCLESAPPFPVDGVYNVDEFEVSVKDIYEHGYPNGASAGFPQFDDHLKWYPGVLTVVTGPPAHGKSAFMDNIMVRLSQADDWRWAVFSPEHSPEEHIMRLAEIYIGKPMLPGYSGQMQPGDRALAMSFLNEYFKFIIPDGESATLNSILEKASYLVAKYGIRGLTIDPWAYVEHDYGENSETNYVSAQLTKLKSWARRYDVHVALVAHPRKMETRKKDGAPMMPSLYDISGSAHFYNKTDNGFVVWRDPDTDETNVWVQKVKRKWHGHTGRLRFSFDVASNRFTEESAYRRTQLPAAIAQFVDGDAPF